MKIFIIGGHGTIGRKVAAHFQPHHEVVIGGRTQGDVLLDMTDSASIEQALASVGPLDAIL
ncbi:MAG TPA: short chain dehydrogenase, partial [Cytophagales bacterium]|nr:short chain dehydrogenase [Cytophagales bacterium]